MFGDFGKMMKVAMQVKQRLPEVQAKLECTTFEATAGGGAVAAGVNGKMKLVDLRISPELLTGAPDAAMIEDLVKAAVSAAQAKAADAAREAMAELTGGMSLPGMEAMM
jgi:hypothetical protein